MLSNRLHNKDRHCRQACQWIFQGRAFLAGRRKVRQNWAHHRQNILNRR